MYVLLILTLRWQVFVRAGTPRVQHSSLIDKHRQCRFKTLCRPLFVSSGETILAVCNEKSDVREGEPPEP